jgi:hypothetical protein
MYFVMGRPIDTRPYRGRQDDAQTLRRVRGRVARELAKLIAEGTAHRARDRDVGPIRRLVNRL